MEIPVKTIGIYAIVRMHKEVIIMAKNETFGWLALYGIQRHQFNFEDIDIADKLMLQGQINARRKEWHELILILDEVQGKLIS